MFSQEKINTVLKMYYQCGSVTKTIRTLGYPARRTMYLWIENEEKEKFTRKELNITNTAEHPRNPSVDIKDAAKLDDRIFSRCCISQSNAGQSCGTIK